MNLLNARGATLIELMISVTISTVVVMTLVGVTSLQLDYSSQATARGRLSVDIMELTNYFAREIPSAGGELLPVWSGVIAENNCAARATFPACQGSDRLTIVKTSATSACSIRSVGAGGLITIETGGGPCCLATLGLLRSHVILSKVNLIGHRYVASVDLNACTATLAPGPTAFNDNVAEPYDWSTGLMVPVQLRTFYLDKAISELNRFTYQNGGTNMNSGVTSALADRILDFQIALGFDFDPADGIVRNTSNHLDEYLYNSTTATERLGAGVFLNVSRSQLRMVALGLAMGQQSGQPNSQGGSNLLDGPLLAPGKWLVENQVSTFTIRSTRTYQ